MWSYIAGGLIIKVILNTEWHFGSKLGGLIIKGGLKIKGCKVEGLLHILAQASKCSDSLVLL